MKLTQEFKRQITTLIFGAFSLVAALAWNDAIKSFIETIYPVTQNGLWAKFLYAFIITVVVVVVSIIVTKLNEEKKAEDKK
jgi:uncharacterized BrkB/YihY/UPF0761 family membrane protein